MKVSSLTLKRIIPMLFHVKELRLLCFCTLLRGSSSLAGNSENGRKTYIVFLGVVFGRKRSSFFLGLIMPVPLAPYPTPLPPYPPPPNGGQSQLVCSGCRNLLLYPVGATSVCCAVCNAVTAVPPPGTEMAQLVCGGCHTLLMYIRGATSVQCSCCHTVNLALEANQVAHVNCGNCRMLLMYQYGARSVKCAVCNFVTSVGVLASTTEQKFST
ncbi:protein LOL1 [Senna tora]|uniref:Protein LOL1 n=1 Tax=Senna tora TaxID=362788 RepID=A0A834TUK2_9FABA|nr:protein LOL1 [Senna tora]